VKRDMGVTEHDSRPAYTLDKLPFENSYSRLPDEFCQHVNPEPLQDTHLIDFSARAAALIQLDPQVAQQTDFCAYFTGQKTMAGARPVAMCYAGHQFGVYVPRLGDGRAILLGQVRNDNGELWDIQVKGSGPTRYSRQGDGRAVLRSTIREYLCSEAMAGLGIPTTRALCLMGSGQHVYREQPEPAAMLVRLAQSHIRFGSFEYFYYSDQYDYLRSLADYVLLHYLPELMERKHTYLAMLDEAVKRTARLMAQWMGVGFAHGVMNSDNMSILGLTLDYGPFGFLDTYQEGFICNHSDHQGRYAFGRQPEIALFNLTCLAQSLLPLLSQDKDEALTMARACLESYWPQFQTQYQSVYGAKLGIDASGAEDFQLWQDLLKLMEGQVDYTRFFRALCTFDSIDSVNNTGLRDQFVDREGFDAWVMRYQRRVCQSTVSDDQRAQKMRMVNPKYILRNYLAEQAIRQAEDKGDYSEISQLLMLLQNPFDEQPEFENYAASPPDWSKGISVSCSS